MARHREKTSGGLEKNLFQNKWGEIVSRKKHFTAKKKKIRKYGYFAKKGKFGAIKKKAKTSKKR